MPSTLRRALSLAAAAGLLLSGSAGASTRHERITPLEGMPRFDHVVVLTEENESAATTFGPGSPAAYLNSLRADGVFLPNYYGTGHASLDNYIAMTSGQAPEPATMGDCAGLSLWTCVQLQSTQSHGRNLGDQLDEAGVSWKSYQDGTSTPCFHAAYAQGDTTADPYQGNSTTGAKNYADRHNPFIYYPDVIGNQARCDAHQRPIGDLATDLASKHGLPAFSFITPDTCNDGHDDPCAGMSVGGLTTADAWLRANVPSLLTYLGQHNGLLVINFDEGSTPTNPTDVASQPTDLACTSCALGGVGGRTGALLLSPRLPQGSVVTSSYDHYSLLRSVEDGFGIAEHLNLAAHATSMAGAFAGIKPADSGQGEEQGDQGTHSSDD